MSKESVSSAPVVPLNPFIEPTQSLSTNHKMVQYLEARNDGVERLKVHVAVSESHLPHKIANLMFIITY